MKKIIAVVLACILIIVSVTGCADMNNEPDREVIVYSAAGEEIWRFEGKFNVRSFSASYADGYFLFKDENGKNHSIYFENGTVIINEI